MLPHTRKPLVTVIIPARNAEATISNSIDSALQQSHACTEVVVINDSSSDQTVRIVQQISDSRVKLVHGEGTGAAAARNLGIREAQGEFFQFLDADDLLSREKLKLQLEALGESSNVASCAWMHLGKDNKLFRPNDTDCWRVKSPTEWLCRSLSGQGMMQTACWLIPRKVAESAGPWNETLSLHDDGEYFCRVLMASEGNIFVDGCHVAYRIVQGSLSRTRSRSAIESAYKVCDSRSKWLLGSDQSQAARRAIATQWLQFVYEFGGASPDLGALAVHKISELNTKPFNVVGGKLFRAAISFLGWRSALSVRQKSLKLKQTLAMPR